MRPSHALIAGWLAASHPAIDAWLGRMAQLPGWKSAYDLLPGKRLTHYAK